MKVNKFDFTISKTTETKQEFTMIPNSFINELMHYLTYNELRLILYIKQKGSSFKYNRNRIAEKFGTHKKNIDKIFSSLEKRKILVFINNKYALNLCLNVSDFKIDKINKSISKVKAYRENSANTNSDEAYSNKINDFSEVKHTSLSEVKHTSLENDLSESEVKHTSVSEVKHTSLENSANTNSDEAYSNKMSSNKTNSNKTNKDISSVNYNLDKNNICKSNSFIDTTKNQVEFPDIILASDVKKEEGIKIEDKIQQDKIENNNSKIDGLKIEDKTQQNKIESFTTIQINELLNEYLKTPSQLFSQANQQNYVNYLYIEYFNQYPKTRLIPNQFEGVLYIYFFIIFQNKITNTISKADLNKWIYENPLILKIIDINKVIELIQKNIKFKEVVKNNLEKAKQESFEVIPQQ
jgi:hypothetical protein